MSARDVKKQVLADLDAAIDNNIDGWNDYLSDLVAEGDLLDIQWKIIGAQDGGILLEVTGYVEDESEGDDIPIKSPDNAYFAMLDQMEEKVYARLKAEGLEPPFTVCYSAYPSTSTTGNLPVDNLDEIAWKGKGFIVEPNDAFWGEGKDFKSEVLDSPTWLDLCVVAERMIRETGDTHHCYLESVVPVDKHELVELAEEGGAAVPIEYRFFMGS